MVKEEYLSVKAFALKVGLSPQAIYQRLDKDLKEFSSIKNGKKVISINALELFGFKDFKENLNKENSSNSSDLKLEALLKQLEIKDKQIESLTEALQTEQKLHAATAKQLLLLTESIEQPQSAADQEQGGSSEPEPEAQEQRPEPPEPELSAWQLFKLAWHKTWYN